VPVVRVPIDPRRDAVTWEWPTMQEVYVGLLERHRPAFARAVVELAQAEPPVAVHCAGGRDRTGIVCALVSRLAGVEADAIVADHAMSDESWGPHNERWFAEAPDETERARRRRISAPAGRAMLDVLDRIGHVRDYLRSGGAADPDLDTLVLRLRG
jgi:hypothetical protein